MRHDLQQRAAKAGSMLDQEDLDRQEQVPRCTAVHPFCCGRGIVQRCVPTYRCQHRLVVHGCVGFLCFLLLHFSQAQLNAVLPPAVLPFYDGVKPNDAAATIGRGRGSSRAGVNARGDISHGDGALKLKQEMRFQRMLQAHRRLVCCSRSRRDESRA